MLLSTLVTAEQLDAARAGGSCFDKTARACVNEVDPSSFCHLGSLEGGLAWNQLMSRPEIRVIVLG